MQGPLDPWNAPLKPDPRNLIPDVSEDRQILWGLVRVGVFVVLGKLAATAKEMAVAGRYGVSESVNDWGTRTTSLSISPSRTITWRVAWAAMAAS